jgi:dnd system-associated protein 4
MADRVRRPERFKDFLTEITHEKAVFRTYKDAMVFAACLGYSRGKRVPFEKTSEPINLQVFGGKFDEMVLNTIAIAELDDPFVMARNREEEKIRIFEEYACGGLEIMENEVAQGKLAIDEGLISMIMGEEESDRILDEITELGKL